MLSIVQRLVIGFVTLIVGLSLITTLATQTNAATSLVSTSESIDITSARIAGFNGTINETTQFVPTVVSQALTGFRSTTTNCRAGDIITGTYANASGSVYTPVTDYVTNSAGYFTLKNTALVNGSTNVTVFSTSYCPDAYLSQDWSRSVINLVAGFFALALLAVAVGLFYSVARETEII